MNLGFEVNLTMKPSVKRLIVETGRMIVQYVPIPTIYLVINLGDVTEQWIVVSRYNNS